MEEIKRIRYIKGLARLLFSENAELPKLYYKRMALYWFGMIMVVGSIMASIKPIYPTWIITLIGIVGSYLLCMGIYLRQFLATWPTLKEHLNQEKIADAANENKA